MVFNKRYIDSFLIILITVLIIIILNYNKMEKFTTVTNPETTRSNSIVAVADSQMLNTNYDFNYIKTIVQNNFNNLRNFTSNENDVYQALVANIEVAQASGTTFDVNYIRYHNSRQTPSASGSVTNTTSALSGTTTTSASGSVPDSSTVSTASNNIILNNTQLRFFENYVYISVLKTIFAKLNSLNTVVLDYLDDNHTNVCIGGGTVNQTTNQLTNCILRSGYQFDCDKLLPTISYLNLPSGTQMTLFNLYITIINHIIDNYLLLSRSLVQILSISTKNMFERAINQFIIQCNENGLYYLDNSFNLTTYYYVLRN